MVIKLSWLKPIAIVLVLFCAGLFGFIIFGHSDIAQDDYYLLPSILGLNWSMLMCAFLFTFPYVPSKPIEKVGFFKRIKIALQRFYYFVLAIVTILITFAMLFMSIRGLRVWLSEYSLF
jgi:hypothetical protein